VPASRASRASRLRWRRAAVGSAAAGSGVVAGALTERSG
jgi:hypothetical protein